MCLSENIHHKSVIHSLAMDPLTLMEIHKRFKRTPIYYDIDNTMQIFWEIPFFRPQNNT